jgi:hypothetical protein
MDLCHFFKAYLWFTIPTCISIVIVLAVCGMLVFAEKLHDGMLKPKQRSR